MGIKQVYPDLEGTKIIFVDENGDSHILLPALQEAILIADVPKDVTGFLWDLSEPHVFISFSSKCVYSQAFVRYSVHGKHSVKFGETKLNPGQIPLMLCAGELALYVEGGHYKTQVLNTHLIAPTLSDADNLNRLLVRKQFDEAFKLCHQIGAKDLWLDYGKYALAQLEPEYAMRAYQRAEDTNMVYALNNIRYTENVLKLAGSCCLLLEKYPEAKGYFMKGGFVKEALDLCRNLLYWDQALQLAQKYERKEVPFIAREYAQDLESSAKYSEALHYYEKSYNEALRNKNDDEESEKPAPEVSEHLRTCKMGIARTCLRTGDFRRGIQYAVDLNDSQLFLDCADLLATVGHLTEAASLYELGAHYDQAFGHYVALKMWNKAGKILPLITSPKLHQSYAKAKEAEGQYEEALKSYRIAGDLDACVRLQLDHFDDPEGASEIVMSSRSKDSALMLAKFYQRTGDIEKALQFLLMCGCVEESFTLAQKHNKLVLHGQLLESYEKAETHDFLALAHFFEAQKYTLLAGKYYYLAEEYPKALRFLLKASAFSNEEEHALSLAISCVTASNNEKLTAQLIEFLLGEIDGVPKEPRYLFRLYMSRKRFKDAAKTAVIIANQQQLSGNYKSGRDLLFSMYQELRRNNLPVSAEMRHNLILLHRYTLVRVHVKLGNHLLAAKLLLQVAANISQFPEHIVPILTSTVIECQRAGLKKSAFTYATTLMRPDYRNQLDARYIKKVESVVRKAPKGVKSLRDDIEDETMECPICDANLPNMEVTCYNCKTTLPICIATGQHIIKQLMTSCPQCDHLCFRAEMEKILSESNVCPMCAKEVQPEQLLDVEDIRPYILAAT